MDEFLSAYIYAAKSLNATFDNARETYKNGLILARDKKSFIEAKNYRGEVSVGPIFISSLGPCFDTTESGVFLNMSKPTSNEHLHNNERHSPLSFLRLAPSLENNPCAFIFIYESLKEEAIIPHNLNIIVQESYGHTVSFRVRGEPKIPPRIVWPLHSLVQGGHRHMSLVSDALKIRMRQESSGTVAKTIKETEATKKFIDRLIETIGKACKSGGFNVVSPQSLMMLADGSMAVCCMRGITEDSFLFSKLSSLDQRLVKILNFSRKDVYRELEGEDAFGCIVDSFIYRIKRFDDTFLTGRFFGTSNPQDHRNRTMDNYQRICGNFLLSSTLSIFTLINRDLYHLLDANVRNSLNSYFFSPLYLNEICLGKNMSNVFTFLKNMAMIKGEERLDCGKCLVDLIEELSRDMAETEESRKSVIQAITSDVTKDDIKMITEEITDPKKVSEVIGKTRERKRKGIRNLMKFYIENSMSVFAQMCKVPHQPKVSLQENASSILNNAFFRILFFSPDVTIQEKATVVKNMCDFLSLILSVYFFVDVPTALAERNASMFQKDITGRDVAFFKNLMETTKRKMPKCLLNMHFLNPSKGIKCRNHYSCNLTKHFTWIKEHGTDFFDRYIKPLFTSSCELDCLGKEMTRIYLNDDDSYDLDDKDRHQCNHESKLMGCIRRFLETDTYVSIIDGDAKAKESFFKRELTSLESKKITKGSNSKGTRRKVEEENEAKGEETVTDEIHHYRNTKRSRVVNNLWINI